MAKTSSMYFALTSPPRSESESVTNHCEQQPPTPVTTPELRGEPESPYDKLSQVSVSHRRVDSFEWVMTQSAPNTPPTLGVSSYEPFSPPPAMLISSAPLPVPNERWSTILRHGEAREKRGYFDWWSSPSLENDKGYVRISEDDGLGEHDQPVLMTTSQKTSVGPSRALIPQLHASPTSYMGVEKHLPATEDNQHRPPEELNALGIVFPCNSPPSPPVPAPTKLSQPEASPDDNPSRRTPLLPKKVSFSPIIDEVVFESSSNSKSLVQQPLSWGTYLPSSFLVARPPLARTTSSPASRAKTATRPILRRSTSLNHDFHQDRSSSCITDKSTEMTWLPPPGQGGKRTACETSAPSSMPAQRLSAGAMHTGDSCAETNKSTEMTWLQPPGQGGRRTACETSAPLSMPAQRLSAGAMHTGDSRAETDRAFAVLLVAAQMPARRR